MKREKIKLLLISTIVFYLFFLFPQNVFASPEIGLKPSKSKEIHLEDSLSIGEEKNIEYLIVNLSNEPKTLNLRIAQFDNINSSGEIIYKNETASPSGIILFSKLSQENLKLNPGERKNFNLQFNIPSDFKAGEYLGGLLVEENKQILAISKINIIIEGDLTKSLDASFEPEITEEKFYLNFTLTNTGNTNIKDGLIKVTIINDQLANILKVEKESIFPLESEILPGKTIEFKKELSQKPNVIGEYRIKSSINYGGLTPLELEKKIKYISRKKVIIYLTITLSILALLIFSFIVFIKWFINKRKKVNAINKKWDEIVTNLLEDKVNTNGIKNNINPAALTDKDIDKIVCKLKDELCITIKEEIKNINKKPAPEKFKFKKRKSPVSFILTHTPSK